MSSMRSESFRLTLLPRLYTCGAFALVIGVALAVQVWAALQGAANLESDEATIGLMVRHVLQGEPLPVYMWGQSYLGSLDVLLSVPFFRLMGSSVLALRMSSLLMFGLFLVLQAALVSRWWGRRVALLTLLLLAFPGWGMLIYTYRATFGVLPVLGTSLLLLWQWRPARPAARVMRALLVGLVMGLGLWTHTLFLLYLLPAAIVYLLQTAEWRTLHARLVRFFGKGAVAVLPMVVGALLVLAFFAAGCEPWTAFSTVQRVARLALVALAGAGGLAFWAISARRRQLLALAGSFGLGVVIGNLPQWRLWLVEGITPTAAILPSCPTGALARAGLVVTRLLPAMWGVSSPAALAHDRGALLSIPVILLILAALLAFAWRERQALQSLLTFSPLTPSQRGSAVLALLLVLPVVVAVLGSNTYDVAHVRYLLATWQASAVILALFADRLASRFGLVALLLGVFWVCQVGLRNIGEVKRLWEADATCHSPQALATLEAYLSQRGVRGGFADYWISFMLDFLMDERFVFASYNADRYPPYRMEAAALPVQAWLFVPGLIPPEATTVDDIIRELQAERSEKPACYPARAGPTYPLFFDWLPRMTVLERRLVANWDVWLLRNERAWPPTYEEGELLHLTGRLVSDPAASGGGAIQGSAAADKADWLAYGPYELFFPGHYRACFRLRADSHPPAATLCTLDVSANEAAETLALREVTAEELPGGGGYRDICLPFENQALRPLEFRVHYAGVGDLWLDLVRVEIVP